MYQRYSGDLGRLEPEEGRTVVLGGVTPPVLAHLLARLITDRPQTIFVALPTQAMAEDLAGDVEFFWPEGRDRIHLFPAFEAKPFLAQAAAPDTVMERQWVLAKLAEDDGPRLVAAPAPALLRLVPGPAETLAARRLIQTGAETDLEELKTFLVRHGYTPVGQVESPGDFAVRGYIVDIFPAGRNLPVRVEFFGDLVESMRTFQVEDQRSMESLSRLLITPAREFAYDAGTGAVAAGALEELARTAGWHSLLWSPLAEAFRAGTPVSGLDSWAPLFTDLKPLRSGLGRARVLIHEPEALMKSAEAAWLGLANHHERLRLEERPHLDIRRGWLPLAETFLTRASGWRTRALDLPESRGTPCFHLPVEANVNLKAAPTAGRTVSGQAGFLAPLAARLRSLLGRGFTTHLVARGAEQARRLAEMLADYDLADGRGRAAAGSGRAGSGSAGRLSLEVGQLSGGFALADEQVAYIVEDEIFGVRQRPRRRPAAAEGLKFSSLKSLTPGDFVVHKVHGIGQYQGLVTLQLSYGQKGEFLHLVYKGGDKLYVPVELFKSVGKYVGAETRPPLLDRLGGLTWGRL
ncbi:MAG: hypothetical protein LBC90_02800, partial [Candidatus Adiutrix sp.]|nr:hypothetical protein [Candidatus Adiutrix sp.]